MPGIVIPNVALQTIIDCVVDANPLSSPLTYHLFTNDYTPVAGSVVGSFTECSIAGYTSQTAALAGWVRSVAPDGTITGTTTNCVYTLTDAGTVYGYWVQDAASDLCWAQRFDTPVVFGVLGGVITLTPTFQLKSPIP
jgi:hypothetical protein